MDEKVKMARYFMYRIRDWLGNIIHRETVALMW